MNHQDTFIIKQNDIATNENIFIKVSNIIRLHTTNNIIPIIFSEEIKYINPLFFILLFSEKRQKNIKYAIDITRLKKYTQDFVQHSLRQSLDLKLILLEAKGKSSSYNEIFNIRDPYEKIKIFQSKRVINNTLFVTFDNSNKAISFASGKLDYNYLPIMALRKLPYLVQRSDYKEIPDYWEAKEKRKAYYSRIAIQDENLGDLKKYQDYLKHTVRVFLKSLGLDKYNLHNPLSIILFELIDNIRKHTSEAVDGFFSFHRHRKWDNKEKKYHYEYQIVIADNGKEGVLNTYSKELCKELKKLLKAGVQRELLKDFSETIKELKSKTILNDKKILDSLYSLRKINHTHQIPRVAMHFGIPMLLKMIKVFDDKKSSKNLLEIYTHRNENYYKIYYSGSGNYKQAIEQQHTIKGTYVILTFTDRIKSYEEDIKQENINTLIRNQDYQYMLEEKNREEIKTKIKTFKVIPIDKIGDLSKVKTNSKNRNIGIDAKNIKKNFGELIRELYLFAYKKNIVDIVVFNLDFESFFPHLELMARIMYEEISAPYDKPRNILFYNKNFPSSVFIGGKTKKEFLSIAQTLKASYGEDASLGLSSNVDDEYKISCESSLVDKRGFILPFELFPLKDQYLNDIDLLESMLNNYLNNIAKKDNIHVDTGVGYHINRFMEFKKVFEDSRWVKRLAFRLAIRLNEHVDNGEKIYLLGTDKYTNMLISLSHTFLRLKNFEKFKYRIFNIYDEEESKKLRKKIQSIQSDSNLGDFDICLVSSVSTHGKRVEALKAEFDINAIPAIKLDMGNSTTKSLLTIKSEIDPIEIEHEEYCEICNESEDKTRNEPLLELNRDNPFFIRDTFFEFQPKKAIKSYSQNPYLFDSLYFGHTARGNNHFLFYINTIKFFNQNQDEITAYLKKVKDKIGYNPEDNEKIILLTSSHDTNNNFIALVNQVVFNNEAIVLGFDKLRGEANFHDLESYQLCDWENTRVFFVDDSIASSHTFRYFYQLLKSMPNIESVPNVGFDGVMVMIDRISSYDERVLCNYLKSKDDNKNVKSRLNRIYAFSTFDVKPIKSEIEECFLCRRKNRYTTLAKDSALDLMTFQMARRAYKLRLIDYKDIKSAHEIKLIELFKLYLKTMATDYIFQNYAHNESKVIDSFKGILIDFSDTVSKKLLEDKEERFSKYNSKVIKKIVRFQSEIALIKALSSPKLSYYYSIRKLAIAEILRKLQVGAKTHNKEFEFKEYYRKDIEVEINSNNSLDKKDKKFLQFYAGMSNAHFINVYFAALGYFKDSKILDTSMIRLFFRMTENDDVRDYKDNQNSSNSLLHTYPFAVKFTTAYNKEKAYYFEANLNKVLEDKDLKYKNNERKKKFSLMNALKMENTLYWREYVKSKYVEKGKKKESKETLEKIFSDLFESLKVDQESICRFVSPSDDSTNRSDKNSREDRIVAIKQIIEKLFEVLDIDTISLHLFVSPYATAKKDYADYLNKSENELVDILDSFASIKNYPDNLRESVQKIFYGAKNVAKSVDDDVILEKIVDEEEIFKKIDDTWANEYSDEYIVVRLTSVNEEQLFEKEPEDNREKSEGGQENDDEPKPHKLKNNNPVWFKPIGCIAIKHDKEKYDQEFHMKIVRTVLSFNQYIVGYINGEFSYGKIQEAIISNRIIEEIKIEYQNILSNINHSVKEYLNIKAISEHLVKFENNSYTIEELQEHIEDIRIYSFGLRHLSSIAELEMTDDSTNYNVYKIFYKNDGTPKAFLNNLNKFIKISHKFLPSKFLKMENDIRIEDNSKGKYLLLDFTDTKIGHLIFEIIFNALKCKTNDGFQNIEIEFIENGIKFKNKLIEEDRVDTVKMINGTSDKKGGFGMSTIREALNKHDGNYEIEADIDAETKDIITTIKGVKDVN